MIFVTVGSSHQPFARLLAAMDEMAPRLGEPVLMQSGRFVYPGRHAESFGYTTFGRVQRLARECRVLVGQASTGALLMARRYGKPLVLVPRDPAQGETFDDHQFQTARSVEGRSRLIEVAYDIGGLEEAVRRAQAKADAGLTYEPDPDRERLVAAIRDVAAGRQAPAP